MQWSELLGDLKQTPDFKAAMAQVVHARRRGVTIYPAQKNIFAAFRETPLNRTRVVILGQDPYHGPGQAHGLCFSVPSGEKLPPSLRNIFKEIESDCGCSTPDNGCLSRWARQGVLLLNTVLTVEQGKPQSHADFGWQAVTDEIILRLGQHHSHQVFMLWGANARRKRSLIDHTQHTVLEAPHPSPLSAHRGFIGCRHFSRCNKALLQHGQEPINWCQN